MAQSLLSDALCTLQDLKDYLGITSSTFDTRLTMAINQGSKVFLDYTDRTFKQTSYTDDVDGTGVEYLQATHYPIIGDPTQVNIDGARDFAAATDLTLDTHYTFDADTGIFTLLEAPIGVGSSIWPRGKRNVRLKYSAGYASTPDSVKHIVVEYAGFLFKNQGARGHVQQSLGGVFVGESTTGIPKQFRELMDPWRRVHDDYDVLGEYET